MKRTLRFLGTAMLASMIAASPAMAAKTLKAAYFVSPKHPIGVGYQFLAEEFVENDLKLTVKNATETLHLADGAEFVANYRKLYDKYEKLVAPLGKDEKKLSELLYNEVYSKLDVATFGMK